MSPEPPPRLTVIIPFLNEENNLPRCLSSLASQDYPINCLEVLLVDGGSTDGSLAAISEFTSRLPVTVLDNSQRRWAEFGKGLAMSVATGEFVQCIDADMWMPEPHMLQRLAQTLASNPDVAGAVACYFPFPGMSLVSRYLACDSLQRDPVHELLTPGFEPFVVATRDGISICKFGGPRVPLVGGTTMFRRESITMDGWGGAFLEVDQVVNLVERGLDRFAIVPDCMWAHNTCRNLRELARKRRRNLAGLGTSYLELAARREYVWVDTTDPRALARIAMWVIGTHLVIPRLLEGIVRAVRMKRFEPLLRPIVALVSLDATLAGIVGCPGGRQLLRAALKRQPLRPSHD